jgi:hypothetical protein
VVMFSSIRGLTEAAPNAGLLPIQARF